MKGLVTGGSGWLGSHLISVLKEKGFETVNFDLKNGQDIRKTAALKRIFQENDFDFVYHCAAQAYLGPGEEDPYDDLVTNTMGMLNVLKCIEGTPINLIYTSTGAVYGRSELPHREDMLPRPMGNYGISKLAAELYLQKEVATKGIHAEIVRFSSVYGAGRKAGPVDIFVAQALKGGPLTIHGGGNQTRDMVHYSDVINGLELVRERGRPGEVYNIGTGIEHSVGEVAFIVKRHCPHVEIEYVKHAFSPFDLPRSWFDISKARKLGYEPKIDLEFGIELTMHDLQEEKKDSQP